MLEVTTRSIGGLRIEAASHGVSVRMDEPPEAGGEGTGLTPQEALLAALSGCSAMTLLLYARRKQWPLANVIVHATLERPAPGQPGAPRIVQTVTLEGALDAEQRKRLHEIAGKCPVHRLLEGPVTLEERLA